MAQGVDASAQPALLPKLVIELGPLLVFFAANAVAGIYAGTAAFMVATLISLAVARIRYHKVPVMPLVSGVIVLVFGGLTLYLRDETFIKLKPTIVYSMFAVLLAGGLMLKKPLLELLFGPVFALTEEGWRKLTCALDCVLRRHGDRQRDRLAQFLDRCLGQLQGLRLPAAHLPVRARAGAAVATPWRAAAEGPADRAEGTSGGSRLLTLCAGSRSRRILQGNTAVPISVLRQPDADRFPQPRVCCLRF